MLHMAYYTQLKEFERIRIYEGIKSGLSMNMIAQEIGRDKSTISREVARNSDQIGYLYPRDAQKHTNDRKARHGSKISRNPALKAYILEKAKLDWAPNVIAGRWNMENPNQSICAEAIYQYSYHPANKDLELWKLFPRTKKKRGVARRQKSSQGTILHRVSIRERPAEIEVRETPGHYEADLMFNQGSQSANILTVVERKSRYLHMVKHESKHSEQIKQSLKKRLGPEAKSCTFDNGKEFALHYQLGIPTFFCNPGSPWQKGSNENSNGLVRRYIPFSMSPHLVTQEYLDSVAYIMNNKPRKILGYLTPLEVFMQDQEKEKESRLKPALPAAEVSFYQKNSAVALHV